MHCGSAVCLLPLSTDDVVQIETRGARSLAGCVRHTHSTPRSHASSPQISLYRGDVVQIETWFQEDGKLAAQRDWLFTDTGTGRVLGRATSTWVMINMQVGVRGGCWGWAGGQEPPHAHGMCAVGQPWGSAVLQPGGAWAPFRLCIHCIAAPPLLMCSPTRRRGG